MVHHRPIATIKSSARTKAVALKRTSRCSADLKENALRCSDHKENRDNTTEGQAHDASAREEHH